MIENNKPLTYKTVKHSFSGMGQTVRAAIRKYNDINLPDETLAELMKEFNKLNEGSLPPKLGSTVLIPVLEEFMHRHTNKQQV